MIKTVTWNLIPTGRHLLALGLASRSRARARASQLYWKSLCSASPCSASPWPPQLQHCLRRLTLWHLARQVAFAACEAVCTCSVVPCPWAGCGRVEAVPCVWAQEGPVQGQGMQGCKGASQAGLQPCCRGAGGRRHGCVVRVLFAKLAARMRRRAGRRRSLRDVQGFNECSEAIGAGRGSSWSNVLTGSGALELTSTLWKVRYETVLSATNTKLQPLQARLFRNISESGNDTTKFR